MSKCLCDEAKREMIKCIRVHNNLTIPALCSWCTNIIEQRLTSDIRSLEGVYRLSGQTSQIKALRLSFDAGVTPEWSRLESPNIHSVGSLLKVGHFQFLFTQDCPLIG